jgi:hypothetical protein
MTCTTARNFFTDSRVVTDYYEVSLEIKRYDSDVIFISPDDSVAVLFSTVFRRINKFAESGR